MRREQSGRSTAGRWLSEDLRFAIVRYKPPREAARWQINPLFVREGASWLDSQGLYRAYFRTRREALARLDDALAREPGPEPTSDRRAL